MNAFNNLRRNCLHILKTTKNNTNFYNIANHASNKLCKSKIKHKFRFIDKPYLKSFILSTSFLTWISFKEEDENKESELIMTIKRSIICMQRKEYVKAEQMLHLALKLAQEQQSQEGITYAYDLMANLALERKQFDKSEKLFVSVLQRLLSTGTPVDDLKVIHISLKLAKIYQMRNEFERAEIGYKWCLESLDKQYNDEKDALMLKGVILDWYSNFLTTKGDYSNSLKCLKEAYKIYTDYEGINNEKSVLLLNDMATVNCQCGDFDVASKNLEEALRIGKNLDEFSDLGTIYANFGIVKIKLGLLNEAKNFCKEGWRLGKKYDSRDSMNQANYCFEQLNNTDNKK